MYVLLFCHGDRRCLRRILRGLERLLHEVGRAAALIENGRRRLRVDRGDYQGRPQNRLARHSPCVLGIPGAQTLPRTVNGTGHT